MSKIMEWCTTRSIAVMVVIGSKIRLNSEKYEVRGNQ